MGHECTDFKSNPISNRNYFRPLQHRCWYIRIFTFIGSKCSISFADRFAFCSSVNRFQRFAWENEEFGDLRSCASKLYDYFKVSRIFTHRRDDTQWTNLLLSK